MTPGQEPITLRRLKWLAVLAPLLYLGAVELLRHVIAPGFFGGWPGAVLLGGLTLVGVLFFAETIFGVIGRLQARLARQNRELLALHDAGLGILGELDLETVLQRAVDRARALVGARYGALSILGETGGIEAFLTSGITPEERARMGPIPEGHGILGAVITEGAPLRLADLTKDPRSVGYPPQHPPMFSLLAVPVVSHGSVVGNFYLTEKEGAVGFDDADEESLGRFATQAALAIENARLHRRVRALAVTEERERIARELHDIPAQVLGYVNTKAQAAQTLLAAGQPERAAAQIGQLAETARAAYADVRENVLGLRASPGGDRTFLAALEEYLERWRGQSGVAVDLVTDPPERFAPRLAPTAEVQLLRIVQEALANVRKHARAERATVRLALRDGWLEATVADDGVGFAPDALGRPATPRFGLATMRERAEAVGGSFAVDSAPGRGTRVVVRVPTDAATADRGER